MGVRRIAQLFLFLVEEEHLRIFLPAKHILVLFGSLTSTFAHAERRPPLLLQLTRFANRIQLQQALPPSKVTATSPLGFSVDSFLDGSPDMR